MAVLRYRTQEARNDREVAKKARQQGALDAALALRKAEAADALITKTSLGLENVDNTSDVNKPVSTAQQTALDQKLNTWVAAPSSASSTGTAGQVAYDGTHFYICSATNTWLRAAIATW